MMSVRSVSESHKQCIKRPKRTPEKTKAAKAAQNKRKAREMERAAAHSD